MQKSPKQRLYDLEQWRKVIDNGNYNTQLAIIALSASVEVLTEHILEVDKTIEDKIKARTEEKLSIILDRQTKVELED